jgi:thiol-disulfide isomerase/thioredoxin
MRVFVTVAAVLAFLAGFGLAQQSSDPGPSNDKAQKTYKEALEYQHQRNHAAALDSFKKADKQDGGQCVACQRQIIKYGSQLGDWKAAEQAGMEMVAESKDDRSSAIAHYELAILLFDEAKEKHKEELFAHAHDEFTKALAAGPNFPDAILADGVTLAYLNQDDTAKAQFERFVKMKPEGDPSRQRALRYIADPELARARMAPPFAVTASSGQRIALDDLKGKVVLLDFWATWCGPCRAALPHMRDIAKHFEGQPLVILSVSLDDDPGKWSDFVAKNEMTWPQYRDGGFEGPVSKLFAVTAIPHTFTIDSDGVLQDEHIGDASIEGKLKKLIARAKEVDMAGQAAQ